MYSLSLLKKDFGNQLSRPVAGQSFIFLKTAADPGKLYNAFGIENNIPELNRKIFLFRSSLVNIKNIYHENITGLFVLFFYFE